MAAVPEAHRSVPAGVVGASLAILILKDAVLRCQNVRLVCKNSESQDKTVVDIPETHVSAAVVPVEANYEILILKDAVLWGQNACLRSKDAVVDDGALAAVSEPHVSVAAETVEVETDEAMILTLMLYYAVIRARGIQLMLKDVVLHGQAVAGLILEAHLSVVVEGQIGDTEGEHLDNGLSVAPRVPIYCCCGT